MAKLFVCYVICKRHNGKYCQSLVERMASLELLLVPQSNDNAIYTIDSQQFNSV